MISSDEKSDTKSQHRSFDEDSHQGSLFKSSASNTKEKETKKTRLKLIDRLNQIFYIYLKMLMGRELSEAEEISFLSHINNSSATKIKQLSKTFEYANEFDYHMGDIVISFPNPDSPHQDSMSELTPLEAIEMCMSCFEAKGNVSDREVLDDMIFIKAIEQAYFMLKRIFDSDEAPINDLFEENPNAKRNQKSNDYLRNDSQKNDSLKNDSGNRAVSEFNLGIPSQISRSELDDDIPQPRSSRRLNSSVKPSGRLERTGGQNDRIALACLKIESKLQEVKKVEKILRPLAIKEAFTIDYNRLKRKMRFTMTGGGYLKKDNNTKQWRRTKTDTQDFTTLIRNIVMIQLTKLGYTTRTFISSNGINIFCVLYQCDDNLKLVAQAHGITKQLNFQFSDLLSFEPVDINLRPLRMSNRLWRPNEYDDNELTEDFLYLRPKIIKLLNQIKMKCLAREINLSQLNQQIFMEGQSDLVEIEGPNDEEWNAYYQYLTFIKDGILEARKAYKIPNDLALMINGQKKPFELYMKRYPSQHRLKDQITNMDLETIMHFTKVEQIRKEIYLEGRDPDIYGVLEGIFEIQMQQTAILKKYEQIKSFLHIKGHKNVSSRQIKVCKRETLAYQYLELMKDALKVTNYDKKRLKTIWDFMGIDPFEPYIPYALTPDSQAFSQKNRLNSIWRKYNITESGKTSLFSVMERMKINNLQLSERINFNILFSHELVLQVFCLNDEYELFGRSNKEQFSQLFEEYDDKIVLQNAQYPYFYKQLKHGERHGHRCANSYDQQEYSYVEPKLKDLQEIWKFQIMKPWHVPTDAIRNYYGEKIALYFTYLGYYTEMLLPIGILGMVINIIQWIAGDNYSAAYIMPSLIFGYIQIQWTNLMFDLWQQREQVFAIKYGQIGSAGQDQGQERSDFQGTYERSIENDSLNTLTYPDSKKFIKIATTLGIQILLLMIYAAIIIGIFFLAEKLQDSYDVTNPNSNLRILMLEVTVPALVNLVVFLILDEFYDKTAEQLTDYENHQTIEDYEMNFVFKKYFLSFVSLCGPILEIMFMHEKFGLRCSENDCFRNSQYYFSSIFLMQFSMNIWEIIKPYLTVIVKKLQEKKLEIMEKIYARQHQEEELEPIQALSPNDPQRQNQEQPSPSQATTNPFEKLNMYIEEESEKESYVVSPERYGTVDDYMEITLQYSMLALFGMQFPMCFMVAFVWNVLELQTDKLKLLHDMQRPLPLGEKSIGVWNGVLEGLAYLGLITNSGLITFARERIDDNTQLFGTLAFFLIILLSNFFLRFVENTVFGEISFEIRGLMKRHAYLIRSTADKFRGSSNKGGGEADNKKKELKRYGLYKLYGCLISEDFMKLGKYEDVSSDSEVEDHIIHKEEQLPNQSSKKKANVEELLKYNEVHRISDWALKFKLQDSDDPIQFQKSKIFYIKTLTFLKLIRQLSVHAKLWTDDRITLRHLKLRRYKVLIRNLDWRRMLIYKENQTSLRQQLTIKQYAKYQKQLDILELNIQIESNQAEKEDIIAKIDKHVEKHLWLDGRKSIILKVDGVWMHQYRKSCKKLPGIKILQNYEHLLKKYKSLCRSDSKITELLSIDEQFQNMIGLLTETQIKNFSKSQLIQLIEKIQYVPRDKQLYALSSKAISLVDKQLDSYINLEARRQLNILSVTYVPYRLQAPLSTNLDRIVWNLFAEEQLGNKYRHLWLLTPLDNKRTQLGATLQFNVFAVKPQTFRWLATHQLTECMIQDLMVLYQTEIGYHRAIHRHVLSKALRFYHRLQDEAYSEMSLKIPIGNLESFHIQNASPLYNIRDPLVKGYLTRMYKPQPEHYFCNGKTLKDLINNRNSFYSDSELNDFMGATLQTLDFVESEFGMFHGSINLQNFLLTRAGMTFTYTLVDFGMFYWYDHITDQTYFTRAIEANDELWYLSPELLFNYLNPQNQVPICPQKCDMYSFGMVCLQIATLGKMSQQIEASLKECEGDVERAVKRWVVANRASLNIKYPMCIQNILQLIHPDQKQRLLPSAFAAKFTPKTQFNEIDLKINFEEDLWNLVDRLENPKLTQEKIVKIFDGRKNELEYGILERMLLSEYFKQSLYKIEIYLRLQQFAACSKQIAEFETQLLEQFFFLLPYAKKTPDIMFCIDNYTFNQIYDIIEGEMCYFKYILLYLLVKAQFLLITQNLKEASQQAVKGLEAVKNVEVHCLSLIKELTNKQSDEKQDTNLLQMAILNQQQLGELQFQKDNLIKHSKENGYLFKQIKKLPQQLKVYSQYFNTIIMHIHHSQMIYGHAVTLNEEIILEYQAGISYDKKHAKKNFEGNLIFKEQHCIKLAQKLISQYHNAVVQFDQFNDQEFTSIAHDLLGDLLVMNNYIIGAEEDLDKQGRSQLKLFLKGIVFDVQQDFRKGFEKCLHYYYLQIKILQIKQLQRVKDWTQLKQRLQQFLKHLSDDTCVLDLFNKIPTLGWMGEMTAEFNDELRLKGIFKIVADVMDEYYFIGEILNTNPKIVTSFPGLMISNLVHHCSQLVLYSQLHFSDGIYEGYIQLLTELNILNQCPLLNAIVQTKIYHILIHNKWHAQPYYQKSSAEEIIYSNNVSQKVLALSQVLKLQEQYQVLLPYFTEETAGKATDSWLKHQSLTTLIVELIAGYLQAQSKNNLEGKTIVMEPYITSLDAKCQQLNLMSNRNQFLNIEHALLKCRCLLLHQEYELIPKFMDQVIHSCNFLHTEVVLQSDTKILIQLIYLGLLDVAINYCTSLGIKFKVMMSTNEIKWIKKQKEYDIKLFIIKMIDYYFRIQELDIVKELVNLCSTLFEAKSQIFRSTHKSFYLLLQIYKVKVHAFTEELRENVDKYDKKDSTQIEDLFSQVYEASLLLTKNQTNLELSKLLLSQSLEQNEMTEINELLLKTDINSLNLQNQVVLCQLGVKLIIYQILTAQFNEADKTAQNCDQKLFEILYNRITTTALRWQSERTFMKSTNSEISVNQLFRLMHIKQSNFEKFEYNLLIDFDPIKELFINIVDYRTLRQMISFRMLYAYVQCLQALAQLMKGDFRLSQGNIAFVDKFGLNQIDEVKILWINVLMIYNVSSAEYIKAREQATQLLSAIKKKKYVLDLQISISEHARTYEHIEFEQVIAVQAVDDSTILPIKYSLPISLAQEALKPYFDISKLRTEAYLCYLEGSINLAETLPQAVEEVFATQQYVQRLYGLSHMFNAHILRLIASMYAEFLSNQRVRDLENQLSQSAQSKISAFEKQKKKKTIQYLELRVKNKCTPQFTQKFKETVQFINGQIKVLKDIKQGISAEIVCRWCLESAADSLSVYEIFREEYQQESNPYFAYIYLVQSDVYQVQLKFVSAMNELDKAKLVFEGCYASISNPDYCKLYWKTGILRSKTQSMLKNYIDALMNISKMSGQQKYDILCSIIKEQKPYLKHFDAFKTHGFVVFLETNILEQVKFDIINGNKLPELYRKDQKDLQALLQVESEKLQFQKTVDPYAKMAPHIIDLIFKDCLLTLQRDKLKFDYTGDDFIQKAFSICRILFQPENVLYTKIDAQIQLAKQKGKRGNK